MSISKIIEKLNRYFSFSEQKRKEKEKKIKKIIEELENKKDIIKNGYKKSNNEAEKNYFLLELKAVKKLLKKAKKLI